jgi:RNA polymerase sigma-70 factor (ECF subfamily)
LDEKRISVEELYRAHARFVASFLVRLGARESDMEDLLQEVFLVAHRAGGFMPGRARATTWLAEIALRVWANARRARRRAVERMVEADVDEIAGSSPTPEDSALRAGALERVQRCLDELDEDHRAVFVLFELYGERTDDIATALGVPVGTVHSRLHHARRRFRTAWERLARARGAA